MNDQLILDNYLMVLKSTVEVYVHGTLESSNKKVRDLLKGHLDSTMNMQACTYDKMTKCGWYNVSNVDNETIQEVLKENEA